MTNFTVLKKQMLSSKTCMNSTKEFMLTSTQWNGVAVNTLTKIGGRETFLKPSKGNLLP